MLAALILVVLIWSYGPRSGIWPSRWWNEPDYLYGFLVPVFSGYLLWRRRSMIEAITFRGSWWGLVLIALAGAMRWASAYYFFALPDPMSLVPCLAGVALLVGGWPALRWSWPAILFLAFMVPLPGFVAGLLSHPLQRIGYDCQHVRDPDAGHPIGCPRECDRVAGDRIGGGRSVQRLAHDDVVLCRLCWRRVPCRNARGSRS